MTRPAPARKPARADTPLAARLADAGLLCCDGYIAGWRTADQDFAVTDPATGHQVARVARMEGAGLIRRYRAEIALAALAPHVKVFVTVELDNHRAETFRIFERTVARHDEITACWSLGGGFDYLMLVVTPDIAAYQTLMDGLLESRAGLRRYFTYIVTKEVKDAAPPLAALLAGSS